jgi:peptidoglycan/LPS O-acetylase OafA/YrhL
LAILIYLKISPISMSVQSLKHVKKFEEIDYLRGFAILAVIAIHTSARFTDITKINILLLTNIIIDIFSHFAVPSFLFISGFVLSLKYKDSFSKKMFYKKRAKSIIPPYIIFSLFYILIGIVFYLKSGNLSHLPIAKVSSTFFSATSYYHEFFALIVQCYIFYPFLIKSYEKVVNNNKTFIFLLSVLIIQLIWITIRDNAMAFFTSSTYFDSVAYLESIVSIILNRVFLSHIFYFIMGIHVCRNYESMKEKVSNSKKWIILAIIVITGVNTALWINGMLEYGGYNRIPRSYFTVYDLICPIYFVLTILILLLISVNLSNLESKYSNYSKPIFLIGKYSFGIFLIHPLFMAVLLTLIFPHLRIDFNQIIFYPALFILTLIPSYFSIYLISYLPYSEMIIGSKRIETRPLK